MSSPIQTIFKGTTFFGLEKFSETTTVFPLRIIGYPIFLLQFFYPRSLFFILFSVGKVARKMFRWRKFFKWEKQRKYSVGDYILFGKKSKKFDAGEDFRNRKINIKNLVLIANFLLRKNSINKYGIGENCLSQNKHNT